MKLVWNAYKFVFKKLSHLERWLIRVFALSTIILGLAPSVTSFVLKKIISLIEYYLSYDLKSNSYKILIFLCVIHVFLISIKEIISICRFTLYHLLGMELTFDIQHLILEKIRKIPYSTFFTPKFQDLYSNVLKNSSSECFKMVISTTTLIVATIEIISVTIILTYFKIGIIFILIICTIPSIYIKFKSQKNFMLVYNETTKLERKNLYLFNILTDKSYLKEIRLFNLESYFCEKRKINFNETLLKWKKFGKREIKKIIFAQLLSYFGTLFSVWLLIHMVLNKSIQISDFVFYSGIILSFQSACGQFITQMAESYRSILFINQLFDFFSLDENIYSNSLILPVKNDNPHIIEFHNVTFRYPGSQRNVIKHLNFKMNFEEKVSIAGENGCGKSTLINLILRHYTPTEGFISLDGVDIQKYDLTEYRKMFSGIYQDFQKFAVPMNEFVAFGNMSNVKNVEKLVLAIRKAMINSLAENSPQKYESQLTKLFEVDGLELSGGQWQRLAIARVFFSDAPILILDEPTSALDAFSEVKIYNEINKIQKKLIIFVSHRMHALKYADKIIYMENGSISAIGNHNELIKESKGYRKLFTAKFKK